MTHINNTSVEHISIEAHGDVFSFLTPENDLISNLGLELLFDESNAPNFPVAGVCDFETFTGKINLIKNKILFDFYLYRYISKFC
jgi:hypothetical protein